MPAGRLVDRARPPCGGQVPVGRLVDRARPPCVGQVPPGRLVDRPRAAVPAGRPGSPALRRPSAAWPAGRSPAHALPRQSAARPAGRPDPPGKKEERARATADTQLRASKGHREARSGNKRWLASQRTAPPLPRSNYEFNCNFSIRYWGWNYRGSWHQTCPSHGSSRKDLNWTHSN